MPNERAWTLQGDTCVSAEVPTPPLPCLLCDDLLQTSSSTSAPNTHYQRDLLPALDFQYHAEMRDPEVKGLVPKALAAVGTSPQGELWLPALHPVHRDRDTADVPGNLPSCSAASGLRQRSRCISCTVLLQRALLAKEP